MTGTQADKSAPLEGFKFAWPFPKKTGFLYKVKSRLTMTFVSSITRLLFIGGVNKIVVHNKTSFMKALEDKSRPLITIANHRSNIDDPLMWAMCSWWEFVKHVDRHRYTLAAHNICFSKQWHTTLFALGRCVPCVRGAGVYQDGMNFSVDKLDENQWIHIFPEGKVSTEPIRFKWGIGRLVMDSKNPPIVLPIWCDNMESVWPVHPPYYPRFGHTVNINIGEPIDTAPLLASLSAVPSEIERRKAITDSLQDALFGLAEDVGRLPAGTARKIREAEDKRREKLSLSSISE